MSRRAGGRWSAGLALAAGLVLAGCGVTSVVVDDGGLPDAPLAGDRVGPAVLVAQGNGVAGPYRAWTYRDSAGLVCLEVAQPGVASSGCGPGEEGAASITAYAGSDGGWLVGGGTLQPATTAVVRLDGGGEVRAPVELPPPGVTTNVRFFLVGVDTPAIDVELLDDAGLLLDTVGVTPP